VSKAGPSGGIFAPTLRFHDGRFWMITTNWSDDGGQLLVHAEDPAGPWSEPVRIPSAVGIDPDLAWDDDGTAYVTFSGLALSGHDLGKHLGIQQVRVDLTAGKALEEPRTLWSGTGLKFPEAPHVYRHGEYWYLMIAEGGTERGHGVSVARGRSPEGPFEGHPGNPVLSARSTSRPIQNTGHADLVDTPDGGTALVLLGVRPLGGTVAFSPLGRETFLTAVNWVDDWPEPEPVELRPRAGVEEQVFEFGSAAFDDPGWLAVRTTPAEVASVVDGRLVITGDGNTLSDMHPRWVGRRQRHLTATVSTRVDASAGTGGLAARYDEKHWFALEAHTDEGATTVTALARVAGMAQEWTVNLPSAEVELRVEMAPPPGGFASESMGGDRIRLVAGAGGQDVLLTELDGRFWTAETCASFTGRVLGLYATEGTVRFADYRYRGSESGEQHRPARSAHDSAHGPLPEDAAVPGKDA
jgi:xylan 1,4-beta-xylosidase